MTVNAPEPKVIDMHVHVGLRGDTLGQWGHFSDWYMRQPVFAVFLLYSGLRKDQLTDAKIRAATERTIAEAEVDHVVCLALDPAYDKAGRRLERECHMWVANEYIVELRRRLGPKVLFGASVHPYDPDFRRRVRDVVDQGAVLLKWLPSAQHINLADPRVKDALAFLATAGHGGKPLPLLLHVGAEYAIPPIDPKAKSYDFLSWSRLEDWWNRLANHWYRPDVATVRENLRSGLDAGATIIFAHCGLPYFASGPLGFLEHNDFPVVAQLVAEYRASGDGHQPSGKKVGRAFADVSSFCTPLRKAWFPDVKRLPPGSLLAGSDFPVPVFELSADADERKRDLKAAVLEGKVERLVVPQGNLLDVNLRELRAHFGFYHPMFTNFWRLMTHAGEDAAVDRTALNGLRVLGG